MDEESDQHVETTSNTAPTAFKYVKTSRIVYNDRERGRKRKREKKLRDQRLESDRIQQQRQRANESRETH